MGVIIGLFLFIIILFIFCACRVSHDCEEKANYLDK